MDESGGRSREWIYKQIDQEKEEDGKKQNLYGGGIDEEQGSLIVIVNFVCCSKVLVDTSMEDHSNQDLTVILKFNNFLSYTCLILQYIYVLFDIMSYIFVPIENDATF